MLNSDRYQTYRNTEHNARTVGWALIPEFCSGCPEAAYVTHDAQLGLFFYHDTPSLFKGASIVHDEKASGAFKRNPVK